MRIIVTDAEELSRHKYRQIMPGAYACPESGRLVIIQPDDTGLLILTNPPAEK
jgi:hypothetical protein